MMYEEFVEVLKNKNKWSDFHRLYGYTIFSTRFWTWTSNINTKMLETYFTNLYFKNLTKEEFNILMNMNDILFKIKQYQIKINSIEGDFLCQ